MTVASGGQKHGTGVLIGFPGISIIDYVITPSRAAEDDVGSRIVVGENDESIRAEECC